MDPQPLNGRAYWEDTAFPDMERAGPESNVKVPSLGYRLEFADTRDGDFF
jgi:hypothetical protein